MQLKNRPWLLGQLLLMSRKYICIMEGDVIASHVKKGVFALERLEGITTGRLKSSCVGLEFVDWWFPIST